MKEEKFSNNCNDDNIKPCAYCSPDVYKRDLMVSTTGARSTYYTVKFNPKDRVLELLSNNESSDTSDVCDTLPILYCPFCRRRL